MPLNHVINPHIISGISVYCIIKPCWAPWVPGGMQGTWKKEFRIGYHALRGTLSAITCVANARRMAVAAFAVQSFEKNRLSPTAISPSVLE